MRYLSFTKLSSSLTLSHDCLSDLHHDKLVGGVHGQQRRIWLGKPALDRSLGQLHRYPPRWLEVIIRILESQHAQLLIVLPATPRSGSMLTLAPSPVTRIRLLAMLLD